MNIKSIIIILIILIIAIILFNYITNDSITKYLLKYEGIDMNYGYSESERSEKKYKECIEKQGNDVMYRSICLRYKPIVKGETYAGCILKANNDSGKKMKCRSKYNKMWS
jgi:hypothetical protein